MGNYKPVDISDFTLESTRECDLCDENLSRYTNGIMTTDELCDLITSEIIYDSLTQIRDRSGMKH